MNMQKTVVLFFVVLMAVSLSTDVLAKDKKKSKAGSGEAKALSGISIVGNEEAPKSLFIVPWKSSEIGVETGLTSKLLDEKMNVVDKDVFERELDFYSATNVR